MSKSNKKVKRMMDDIEEIEVLPTPDGNSDYELSNLAGVKSIKASEVK